MHKYKEVLDNNFFMVKQMFTTAPAYAWMTVLSSILVAADNIVGNALLIHYLYTALVNQYTLPRILSVLGWTALLLLSRFAIRAFTEEVLKPRAAVALMERMQVPLYEKAKEIDLAAFQNPDFYNDYVFALSQTDSRVFGVFDTFMRFGTCILMISGYIAVITVLDAFVLIPAALFLTASYLINMKRVKVHYQRSETMRPDERRRDYAIRTVLFPDFAQELRITDVSACLSDVFTNVVKRLHTTVCTFGKKLARINLAEEIGCNTLILDGGIYAYLAYALLISGSVTVGGMMSLAMSVENVMWRANDLISTAPQLTEHAMYIAAYRRFLAYESKIAQSSGALPPTDFETLTLDNVNFAYGDTPVLENISMHIQCGDRIAIAGENGAGKSTLIKLLLRLYEPSAGTILLNGQDSGTFDLDAWRHRVFSCTFQDFNLYAATLAENVAMNLTPDVSAVEAALTQSSFLHYPLNTPITKEFSDFGIIPSGGEAQKIAAARSFFADADILILDEPSAALDPLSEYAFNRALAAIPRTKTIIFISHRLSTVKEADKIYILHHKTIAECGTHAALLEQNNLYASMWKAQVSMIEEAPENPF